MQPQMKWTILHEKQTKKENILETINWIAHLLLLYHCNEDIYGISCSLNPKIYAYLSL